MDLKEKIDKTILITGLSASGKSTLGKRLIQGLNENGIKNVKLIDGEVVRKEIELKFGSICGYTSEDRTQHSMRLTEMAKEYNKKGYISVICAISHVKSTREKMRRKSQKFMEVFLKCPVEVCAKRDYKGNYKKAFNGNFDCFIGVTEKYQESDNPELILHTDIQNVGECSEILTREVIKFINGNLI